jgi:hypothetical protein
VPDRTVLLRALAVAAVLLGPQGGGWQAAHAQDDFFRSSPGPLSTSHAEIDGQDNCNKCHVDGKALSNDKCLTCHDHQDLKKRIDAGEGYHASEKVKGRKCETCHLEHKGRNFDPMGWRAVGGMKSFDHKQTGWPLQGKHAAIDCSKCHKQTNRQGLRVFLGEDKFCGGCHKEDQPHEFEKKELMNCERCHGESVWNPPKRQLEFDHNDKKDADFPNEGAHAEVSCTKCHAKARFNLKLEVPGDCRNCHKSSHAGHLFDTKSCDWCHSPRLRTFDKFQFAHDKRTRFDLAGAHGKLGCYDCHSKQLGKSKPDRNCEVCHAGDNKHRDRFKAFGEPPRCATCHPSSSWKPEVFDHNSRTRFMLTGKHGRIECRACHRGDAPHKFERFNPATVGCMGCHEHKTVHDGVYTDKPKSQPVLDKEGRRIRTCLECHNMPGGMSMSRGAVNDVHGPKGRYPLLRGHAGIPCAKCHVDDMFANTPTECGVRCHQDSLHRGSLGDKCSNCHRSGQWEAVFFDHSEDTKWPLRGLHQSVPECEDCHPARAYAETPTTCSARGCHAKDDAHNGKLGLACEKCHVETGENIFDHNTQAAYKLDGAHLTTRCADCHPTMEFKPQPTNCFGCHPEPEVHEGQYGTLCETCHVTSAWKNIQPLHDVGDFSLKGSHDNLPCRRCHLDNRPLAGAGNLCINCHRQDDIHNNSLSPRCGECHNQWAFAPARFDHTTVGCNLIGLHRVLPCHDCHKAGNFGALSAQCVGCHRDSALRAGMPGNIPHAQQTVCSSCHNPNSWKPASPVPNSVFGRESICR